MGWARMLVGLSDHMHTCVREDGCLCVCFVLSLATTKPPTNHGNKPAMWHAENAACEVTRCVIIQCAKQAHAIPKTKLASSRDHAHACTFIVRCTVSKHWRLHMHGNVVMHKDQRLPGRKLGLLP